MRCVVLHIVTHVYIVRIVKGLLVVLQPNEGGLIGNEHQGDIWNQVRERCIITSHMDHAVQQYQRLHNGSEVVEYFLDYDCVSGQLQVLVHIAIHNQRHVIIALPF